MRRRIREILTLTVALALLWATPAFALRYFAAGDDKADDWSSPSVDGNLAKFWVQPASAPIPIGRVNSLYIRQGNQYRVETGWAWDPDWTFSNEPKVFVNGKSPATGVWEQILQTPVLVRSTWTEFAIRKTVHGSLTDDYTLIVGGVNLGQWFTDTGMWSGFAQLGSERDSLSDDGYGSWTYAQYRSQANGAWYKWTNAARTAWIRLRLTPSSSSTRTRCMTAASSDGCTSTAA